MTWLSLLQLLLSVADKIAGYLDERQKLEGGMAVERAKNLTALLANVRKAEDARARERDRIARDGVRAPDANSRD